MNTVFNLESRKEREESLDTYWREILYFLIGEQAATDSHQVL